MLLAFSFLSLLLPFVYYLGSAWANLAVTCDYQQGAGLEARSCFDAWNLAPRSPQQEKWLPNYSPPPHLPGTVISPKVVFSNDTTCAIYASLDGNSPVGRASAFNISEAARTVILNCVIPRRIGGYARNIGGDNKVNVNVRKSIATAKCGNPVAAKATERSCAYILDEILKTRHMEYFGKPTSPSRGRLTVALPLTLRSPDGGCMIVVDMASGFFGPVPSAWALVWQAAEAATALCIRQGKAGEALVPDSNGDKRFGLLVRITDEPADLGVPAAPAWDVNGLGASARAAVDAAPPVAVA